MGVHNQEFDSLDDLYTNEYFKDTTDYMGGDPMDSVLDYDDMSDSDYVLALAEIISARPVPI